jgi:prophage regulatory protein
MSDQKIWKLPVVTRVTALSKSTIYDKIARGEFPAPVHLSTRAVGWLASEVEGWLEARIADSRGPRT